MYKDQTALYEELRKTYPVMIYEEFKVVRRGNEILAGFHFNLADTFHFRPFIVIPARPFFDSPVLASPSAHPDCIRA
jgi:hypothetical protein